MSALAMMVGLLFRLAHGNSRTHLLHITPALHSLMANLHALRKLQEGR
jgi:hypothetical protein